MAAANAGRDARTVEQLRRDLERANLKIEEVSAYYRGQLEAERRKIEDELTRVQAAEAGRRRRAEDQVATLRGELKAARAESEHAQRRYQELHAELERMESEGRDHAREAVNRQQEAAQVAWRTAEEEVAKLESEIGELQKEMERERERRRQIERSYEQLEEDHVRRDKERRRLLTRLKRALKASESRRAALESQIERIGRAGATDAGDGASDRSPPAFSQAGSMDMTVDPNAGWGRFSVGGSDDDFADEFLLAEADESIRPDTSADAEPPRSWTAGSPGDNGDSRYGIVVEEVGGDELEDEVSDVEAENMMMQLDVEQKVAARQTRAAARASREDPVGGGSWVDHSDGEGRGPSAAESLRLPEQDRDVPATGRIIAVILGLLGVGATVVAWLLL